MKLKTRGLLYARIVLASAGGIGLLTIAFNNCAGFSGAKAALKSVASSCLPSRKAERAALDSYDVKAVCEDIASYRCDMREFRPGAGSSSDVAKFCLSTLIGDTCLPVSVTRYDTSANASLSDLAREAFDEGGEFNHAEVSCYNERVLADGHAVLKSDAGALAQALDMVIAKCRERSL